MLRKLDFEEIAKANPSVTVDQMEEWGRLRGQVTQQRKERISKLRGFPFRKKRARVVDDLESDTRVIKLHRR